MNATVMPAHRPAFREPMLWLVVALPLAAVIAGFVTLGYAVGSASDPVNDDVRRVAQIQTANLAADSRAAALGLVGTLSVDGSTVVVSGLPHETKHASAAVLRFEHSTDASRDVIVRLQQGAGGSMVGQAQLAKTRYNLTLLAADATWRLRGRLENCATTAALSPQVSRLAPWPRTASIAVKRCR